MQAIRLNRDVADEFIINALTEKLDYIAGELLANSVVINENIEADYTSEFSINDNKVSVSVVKGE